MFYLQHEVWNVKKNKQTQRLPKRLNAGIYTTELRSQRFVKHKSYSRNKCYVKNSAGTFALLQFVIGHLLTIFYNRATELQRSHFTGVIGVLHFIGVLFFAINNTVLVHLFAPSNRIRFTDQRRCKLLDLFIWKSVICWITDYIFKTL